jgi:hypothetical protein
VVQILDDKLLNAPIPKAAWKKLVQQLQVCVCLSEHTTTAGSNHIRTCVVCMLCCPCRFLHLHLTSTTAFPLTQVPLQVGAALRTAAKLGCTSPVMVAALGVLDVLLREAKVSGLIKDDAAAGNLAASMQQQLQQTGVLAQLAGVMAGLAAELRSDAAAIRGSTQEQLCSDLQRFELCSQCSCSVFSRQSDVLFFVARLQLSLRLLWTSPGQSTEASSHAWVCDPNSGMAEASMQLVTAALQHTSSVLQRVLPAAEQRDPQHAAALLHHLGKRTHEVLHLGGSVGIMLLHAEQYNSSEQQQQHQHSTAAASGAQAQCQLQRLLLSPHTHWRLQQ